ncbi:MAG TPA: hypothetical protein P5527_00555 [Kiritimatiellia bacterium]|jgi:hypothetical protein|nr:hypothetical protein [Kiritimatiellia bacterium]
MAYAKIPEKEASLLVRALGLLVNQAGVYGPTHNVTQRAARSVFAELDEIIGRYGAVEIVLRENRLFLNGSLDGMDAASVRNLADRMILYKIGGLLFLPPANRDEFLVFVTLFGTPPAVLAAKGGFETALKQVGLRSIQAVEVVYQRIADADRPAVPTTVTPPATATANVEDLVAAWARDFSMQDAASEESVIPIVMQQDRIQQLAALLRETATMLECDDVGLDSDQRQQQIREAIVQIRAALTEVTLESERHITALAEQVNADRQTIASIESAARRRGLGIRLTRAELVERYAELNQEIIQPLTVSTGVIDMLSSDKAGPLTPSQRDMLNLAAESVERVNQLVAYMRRIAGLPTSLTPDMDTIADTYR